jgi:hypothetical protein
MGLRAVAMGAIAVATLMVGGGSPAGAATAVPLGVNLVKDPGFEAATGGDGYSISALPKWKETTKNSFTATHYGAAGFLTKAESKRVGGGSTFASCGYGGSGTIYQSIPLTGRGAMVDAGKLRATFSVLVATYGAPTDSVRDEAEAILYFLGAGTPPFVEDSLDTGRLSGTGDRFVQLRMSMIVPAHTRVLVPQLYGYRNTGAYCDAYFDNVSVTLTKVS